MADFRKPGDRSEPKNSGMTQEVVSGLVHRMADLEDSKMTDALLERLREIVREELKALPAPESN